MSSSREQITASIVTKLTATTGVKKVTRDPVDITELSRESFPHVYVETANERREHSSFSSEVRRVSDLDIILNTVVMGANRDTARNTVFENIEEKLMQDPTLGGLAYDVQVAEIIIREIAETEPYGQGAMVISVRYFYDRTNP